MKMWISAAPVPGRRENELIELLVGIKVAFGTAAAITSELIGRYCTPSRHYHTIEHIDSVLNCVEFLQPMAENYSALILAAWYHDIVYQTTPNAENERDSADFAATQLRQIGVSTTLVERVHELIMDTRHRKIVPCSGDSMILVDADLATLASPPAEFERNSERIRQEYAQVPDEIFFPARCVILESFLSQTHIFWTEQMYNNYEEMARANLMRAIAGIKSFV